MPNYPLSQINLTNSTYPSGVTLVIKDADARTALAAIQALIPVQATSSNQLADKDFVNSSIATATATFRGTYNLVSDLHLTISATKAQIATALGNYIDSIVNPDKNDYAFVLIPTANDKPNEIASIERYKFNGSAWAFEYMLNNSGFTAAQWAAINSGITSELVVKLLALPTKSEIDAQFDAEAAARLALEMLLLPKIEQKLPIEAMDNFGDVHAKSIDMDDLPKVCGYQMFVIQNGTPSVTPDFIGQIYIDTTNNKVYMATAVTNASSWKALN